MTSRSIQTPLKQPGSWGSVCAGRWVPHAERWVPHTYQKKAVTWLVSRPEAALFLDPGLGKSSIALKAFDALKTAKKSKGMLIVAPLRPAGLVWSKSGEGELAKWLDFHNLELSFLHGTLKQRLKALDVVADIYVINYDGLPWLCTKGRDGQTPIEVLLRRGVDVLCFDELSKMKHARTRRQKALRPYLPKFKRRWGLTGSPAANSLMDLFGELLVLDLGKRLGRYITRYRTEYFNSTGYMGYVWTPKAGSAERIQKQLGDIALSMRAEDHLDLPEMVESNIWVDLPPDARDIYDGMEDDLVAMLDSGLVTAANAAVASGKCRQIASGGLYFDDGGARATSVVHNAKTAALVDLVDELQGSPLLVGYEFHHDLVRIREALGDVPAINGDSSTKQAAATAAAWNRGEIPVLCGHPQAMAHGINLQACGHHIAWYSLTWNFELYDQFIRRVWRQGQKNRVMVYRILARKTVDEAVLKSLMAKERGQNSLLEALKKMRGRK